MKTDRKIKAEKSLPKLKTVKGNGGKIPKTNGKHPLAAYEQFRWALWKPPSTEST